MSRRCGGAGMGLVSISTLCGVALLAAACGPAAATPAPTPAPITITIAHTNDVAGYLEPCG